MKTLLSSLLLLLSCATAIAQNIYTLRITNTQNQPLKNIVVTARNKVKNVVVKATTNTDGNAVFSLSEPGIYTFSYLEMADVTSTEIKEGYVGTFTRTVTYDPKGVFAEKPKADRTGITFKKVPPDQLKGQANVAEITLLVKEPKGALVPGIPLTVVSISDKTSYASTSNAAGKAVFYLPVNREYEIDVASLQAFKTVNVPNHEGMKMTEVVFYEKTKTKETVSGDTIVQQAVTQTSGTSTHVLFTLHLKNYEGEPLADEAIFMDSETSKRVYRGTTDAKGNCVFMLEKGSNYILNTRYERNMHLVEAPATQAFKSASATRRYRGSLAIEQAIAEQKAEMERLEQERLAAIKAEEEYRKQQLIWEKAEAERQKVLAKEQEKNKAKLRIEQEAARKKENKERAEREKAEAARPKPGDASYNITYRATPVEKAAAPANYITKTAQGFNVDFAASGPVGTPTIVENKLFTQQGFYSPNFYCLQAGTGQFLWGLELGESGISPAVYHNGVILINTESCTLYAIDAATGRLLWSKWLSSYLFSTPTAVDNSVYVVYKHGGYPVLVSFNLTSGVLNWMQRVDSEVIASPVAEGSEIHLASQNGTYYVFNKDTGKLLKSANSLRVVSSPVITSDKIYVTVFDTDAEKLAVLNRQTLQTEKVIPVSLNSYTILNSHIDIVDQMNFNGSHPVVYQNKYVILADQDKLMAFDMASEQLLWQQPVNTAPNQLPIVANNKVIIASETGELMSYDVATGTPKILEKSKGIPEGQPIAANGFLYLATAGVLCVIKSIQNYQWTQWNRDAGHNANFK